MNKHFIVKGNFIVEVSSEVSVEEIKKHIVVISNHPEICLQDIEIKTKVFEKLQEEQ
jgi:hypothetical protein